MIVIAEVRNRSSNTQQMIIKQLKDGRFRPTARLPRTHDMACIYDELCVSIMDSIVDIVNDLRYNPEHKLKR